VLKVKVALVPKYHSVSRGAIEVKLHAFSTSEVNGQVQASDD
jgi:hypothetical protein